MKKEKTQIGKIRNAKGETTTNTMEIRKPSKTTLRSHVPINWQILKK
jgi:hypothetical protein